MDNAIKIPDCPVEMTLQLIGDKWKVLIIRDLLTGTKRFNELMRSVNGITQKGHGTGRPDYPQNISPGPPEGGIYPDRNRVQPETHTGLHGSLGNGLQKEHRTNVNAQRAVPPVSLKSGDHGSYMILM